MMSNRLPSYERVPPRSASTIDLGTRLGPLVVTTYLGESYGLSSWLTEALDSRGDAKPFIVRAVSDGCPEHVRVGLESMLVRHSKLVSKIRSPYVLRTYGIGRHGTTHYSVHEVPRGVYLSSKLTSLSASGLRMRASHLSSIASHVARGLHAIHDTHDSSGRRLGLMCPALSAESIIIERTGMARIVDTEIESDISSLPDRRRNSGIATAPEIMRGERPDGRADVYSLGVLLYDALAGPGMFELSTLPEQGFHRSPPPAPSTWSPDVPSALDELVLAATHPCVSRRPQSPLAMAVELERIAREHCVDDPVISDGKTATARGPGQSQTLRVSPLLTDCGPVRPTRGPFQVSAALEPGLARRPPRTGFGPSDAWAEDHSHADHTRRPGTKFGVEMLEQDGAATRVVDAGAYERARLMRSHEADRDEAEGSGLLAVRGIDQEELDAEPTKARQPTFRPSTFRPSGPAPGPLLPAESIPAKPRRDDKLAPSPGAAKNPNAGDASGLRLDDPFIDLIRRERGASATHTERLVGPAPTRVLARPHLGGGGDRRVSTPTSDRVAGQTSHAFRDPSDSHPPLHHKPTTDSESGYRRPPRRSTLPEQSTSRDSCDSIDIPLDGIDCAYDLVPSVPHHHHIDPVELDDGFDMDEHHDQHTSASAESHIDHAQTAPRSKPLEYLVCMLLFSAGVISSAIVSLWCWSLLRGVPIETLLIELGLS